MTSDRKSSSKWNREAQYLLGLDINHRRVDDWDVHPFNLPFVRDLHLRFTTALTFFVGENGSGKSTIIEAIADVCRFPVEGGGRSELDTHPDSDRQRSELARGLCVSKNHVHDGFFVRAENLVRFADLLEERERDPDFYGNPYRAYGGRSMHHQSHGEAFLSIFQHRLQSGGVIIMDEPESALSAQRQLTLLTILYEFVQAGNTQIFIATHSPILMTFPGATILEVNRDHVVPVRLEDTSHYQITRGILNSPEQYWKHLRGDRLAPKPERIASKRRQNVSAPRETTEKQRVLQDIRSEIARGADFDIADVDESKGLLELRKLRSILIGLRQVREGKVLTTEQLKANLFASMRRRDSRADDTAGEPATDDEDE
jgi:predicted ATPase